MLHQFILYRSEENSLPLTTLLLANGANLDSLSQLHFPDPNQPELITLFGNFEKATFDYQKAMEILFRENPKFEELFATFIVHFVSLSSVGILLRSGGCNTGGGN